MDPVREDRKICGPEEDSAIDNAKEDMEEYEMTSDMIEDRGDQNKRCGDCLNR